tara:strand:+ start:1358 stop:1627 length:270 start_codon:yes stop_codon:yes gene_type:complete
MLDTITINDSQSIIKDKLAKDERNAILKDFESDFGFSLSDLPSLDLPLAKYCEQLPQDNDVMLALYLFEMCDKEPHWDCETDAYDRFID